MGRGCVGVAVLSLAATISELSQAQDGDRAGRVAIAGLASNLESFDRYKCKYRVTKTSANSPTDAKERKWVNAVSCDYTFIVDGEQELFECHAPPLRNDLPQIPLGNGQFGVSVPFAKGSMLRRGGNQLAFSPNIQVASLVKHEWGERQVGPTPLDMGIMGYHFVLAPHSLLAKPDLIAFSVGPDGRFGGRAQVVEFRALLEKHYSLSRFYLDPEQGYLPVRHEWFSSAESFEKNNPKVVTELLDVRPCPRGRWFPERVVEYTLNDGGASKYSVTEIQVTELDPDYKATGEEFVIELPPGTYIKAGREGTEYGRTFFRTKQTERVHARDIAGMFALLKKVETTPLADTAIPHKPAFSWWRWGSIAAGILLVLFGGLVLYKRRGRLQPSAHAG